MAIMTVWMLLRIMLVVAGPASCFDSCKPLSDTTRSSGRDGLCGNGQCVCTGSTASCYGNINGQFQDTLPVLRPHINTIIARCYNFSNITKTTFKNIDSASIEKLNVSQCNLCDFAGDSFMEFQNLTVLELSKNLNMNLTQMIEAIQPLNRSLTNLTLTDNMLKNFNVSSYLPFTSLKYLDISGNKIHQVAANVSLINLIYLNLGRNVLHGRKMQFCYNETNITHTIEDSSGNSLKRIEKHSIFPQLRMLDLGRNYLGGNGKRIIDSFDCLWNLEQLDLSNNTIGSVSMNQFKNLNNLRSLLLSSNWIKRVSRGELPPKLERIDFRDNQMTPFPPKLCDGVHNKTFPSLRSLDFGRNYIINLTTNWHTCLPNLEWLDFSKNDVRQINNNTFANYKNLKYLFLSNLIPWTKVIEPAAFNSSSLQNLSLRFNWMNFSSTLSLRQIFQFCPNMKWLDISYNYIENVDLLNKILLPLQQLEHLFLEKMYLYSFPFLLLKSHTQLKTLVLDKNMIYTIPFPDDFNNMTMELNLQELSVAHCVLHTVNQSTFPSKIRSTVKYLNLGDNQFRCDCAMLWFRNAVNTTSGRVKDSDIQLLGWKDNYKCRSPTGLGDHQFWTFEPEEICDFPNPVMIGLITAGASLFVFSILTGVAFWNRWYIKYWWFKIARIRRAKEWKGTEREHLLRQNEQYDAYVVYNTEDNMFVHHAFRELVENELGYKLHIWERDADSGAKVDVVLDAMYAAKHVIVAVSNNILKDQWAKFQVDVALDKSIKENCEVLFVKLDNLDLARISKTWCVLMTRTPAVDWPDDAGSIKYKLVKEILRIRFGKPLHKDACINEPKYDHIPDQEI